MPNRMLIMFGEKDAALNHADEIRLMTGGIERIGDDALARFDGGPERKVRFLRSKGHVRDGTYLVDLRTDECWPYEIEAE